MVGLTEVGRKPMTRRVGAACAIVMACAGAAHGQSASLLGNVDFAVDAAGLHVSKVRLGGLYPLGYCMDRISVPMQTTPALQALPPRDAGAAMGLWQNASAATAGVDAEAGVIQAGGHNRTAGDAAWRIRPAPDTSVELLAAGDLVSTQDAIGRGIAYGFVGSSVERTFKDRFTAIGLAGYQSFTDGNERVHLRAGVVWQAMPEYGLNVQWRWREYASRKEDVEGAYFNPSAYSQNQVAAGVDSPDSSNRQVGATLIWPF
jgi:hypothetical protein